MENDTFIESVKVGVGVVALGFFRTIFTRFFRRFIILTKHRHREKKASPNKKRYAENTES
jgi:hypothetical protein